MATLRHSLNGCIAFFTAALPLSVPVTKRFEAFDLQMLQENLPRTPCCCFHAQDASRDWLQPPCSLGSRTSDHDAPTPKVNRSPCTEFSKRREITWAALITLILTTVSHLPAISSRMELTHCQAVSEREAAHADCTIGLSSACKKSPWDSASICMETRRRGCLFLPTVLPNRVPVVVVCPSPSISLPETHPSPSPSLSNKSGHESLLSPTRMTSSDPGKEWDVVLETLNTALKHGRVGDWTNGSPLLCGQTVSVVIPERESSQTTSMLRQLLLREIDKEVKALGAL